MRRHHGFIAVGVLAGFATITAVAGSVFAVTSGKEAAGAPAGMVQVTTTRENGDYLCGGSLIHAKWVLTAAHCAEGGKVKSIKVLVGSLERDKGTAIKVKTWQIKVGFDLALLELQDKADSADTAPLAATDPVVGSTGDVFGWGLTETGRFADKLKTAQVKVDTVGGQFCTDGAGGPGVCTSSISGEFSSGDSGGPLFIDGKQVGVVSNSGHHVFASVANRMAWIEKTTGLRLNKDGRLASS